MDEEGDPKTVQTGEQSTTGQGATRDLGRSQLHTNVPATGVVPEAVEQQDGRRVCMALAWPELDPLRLLVHHMSRLAKRRR